MEWIRIEDKLPTEFDIEYLVLCEQDGYSTYDLAKYVKYHDNKCLWKGIILNDHEITHWTTFTRKPKDDMTKRTIHLSPEADECLRKLYAQALQANEKANFSKIISDALEEYYKNEKSKISGWL
jgi:hypothetical protein